MRIMLPLLDNAILPFCAAARTDTSDFSAPRGSRYCGDMWIHRISCCAEEQAISIGWDVFGDYRCGGCHPERNCPPMPSSSTSRQKLVSYCVSGTGIFSPTYGCGAARS